MTSPNINIILYFCIIKITNTETSFMEEILDQQFHINQPDETQINRTVSIIRFCICAVLLFYLCYNIIGGLFFYPFISIPVSIWLIYHNFAIALTEWKSRYVVNVTDIIATGFASLLYFMKMYEHANTTILYIQYDVIDYMIIYNIVIVAAFIFIGSREIVYLIRDRRLKRLKNE